MTIKQIYNLALEMGVAADPRGKRGVEKWLERQRQKYHKLSHDERREFDRERLTNPYADTRLLFGDPTESVKTILAGIDVETEEIALVKALDQNIDLIITHHPTGKDLPTLDQVMSMQADLMASYGVPINVAEGVMASRIEQVSRSLAPINHMRAVDAARLAKIPMINVHTPCDNLVFQFIQKLIDPPATPRHGRLALLGRRASLRGGRGRKKPETVGEIIEILKKIPEYKIATQNNAGPRIFAGASENRAGKIVAFNITGGAEGAKEIYPELVKAGVGTVIGMHMKDENLKEAIKNHLNVVIAGHISSDSLGMNLFLDKLTAKNIKIIPISGLTRVRRK